MYMTAPIYAYCFTDLECKEHIIATRRLILYVFLLVSLSLMLCLSRF